jgi:Zn-dependent M28 family amino/carboxypeptidase
MRNIEVSVSNLTPHARPERIFIIGAHYDPASGANDNGSGSAAVLELARLLKTMQPGHGTELKFVFLVNAAHGGEPTAGTRPARERRRPRDLDGRYPDTGNFIAYAGTRAGSALVRQALSAFRASSDAGAEGLIVPAYVEGVTLTDDRSYSRNSYPALMISDTAFLRYPYFRTAGDPDDQLDYKGMARVVKGLARTIAALAGGTRT